MQALRRPVILIVESSADDEAMTIRALRKTGIPHEFSVEREGDAAIHRYRHVHAQWPPLLIVVSDRLLRMTTHEFVQVVRSFHSEEVVPVLHLMSSTGSEPCPGSNVSMVKPMDYSAYLEEVGSAASRLLAA